MNSVKPLMKEFTMTKSKALLGAVLLASGLTMGSVAVSAAARPSSFIMGADPHEISAPLMKQTLEQLGFTSVRKIFKDGRIFQAEAQWEGQTFHLRIDARNHSITVDDNPPPSYVFGFLPTSL